MIRFIYGSDLFYLGLLCLSFAQEDSDPHHNRLVGRQYTINKTMYTDWVGKRAVVQGWVGKRGVVVKEMIPKTKHYTLTP